VALELAAEDDDPAAFRQRIEGIEADLGELERLLEDVLTTARLDLAEGDAGLVLALGEVDVAALFGRLAKDADGLHPEQRVEWHVDMDRETLEADEKLLRRLLANLLDNAAKYSDPSDGPIELVARERDGQLAVEVRDRGIGVAQEDLDRLFEPFFRTDRSRERATGGVGLGLALCRRIADAHGFAIEAERREGGGLVMRLSM
jgi:signal transduction histidine kinase